MRAPGHPPEKGINAGPRGTGIFRSCLGMAWAPAVFLLTALAACEGTDDPSTLPAFDSSPLALGAVLCVTGPTAVAAPELERAAILAEQYINGDRRAYPGVAADDIPCRQLDNCGVWSSWTASGEPLRGALRVVTADSEERAWRATSAAFRILEQPTLPALIGPCTMEVADGLFRKVTGTQRLLVSPVVTADALSFLPDRNPTETEDLPGAVYRTVPPDTVQVQILGLLGSNVLPTARLVRYEDESSTTCHTNEAACASLGSNYECSVSTRSATPERDYFRITDTSCAGEASGFCDQLGLSFECISHDGQEVCAQYRTVKKCVRVVNPQTALILYEDSPLGQHQQQGFTTFWEVRQQRAVLASMPFDPENPSTYDQVVVELFTRGRNKLAELKLEGVLETTAPFEDSVVLLVADAPRTVLLLRSWSSMVQRDSVSGAESVFWLGSHRLRNPVVVEQLPFEVLRNLYVTDPSTLDLNYQDFFRDLFQERWGREPGGFAGNTFDAILLTALAHELAGYAAASEGRRANPQALDALRVPFAAVSKGCPLSNTSGNCANLPGTNPQAFAPPSFAQAVRAVWSGTNTRLQGVTGSLQMSIDGDRLGQIALWKIERREERNQFFTIDIVSPRTVGITLEQ